jgi:hypothetical protein
MTLILTRTTYCHALMVTDRKVTVNGAEYDPDANKNVLFHDKNAVVAIAYTGAAYIGTIPTDQWIVQALTGLTFPEGPKGKGSVPAFIHSDYEPLYIGIRVRKLRDLLSGVRPLILRRYRNGWTAGTFDVLITGFEWNHGKVRPFLTSLDKPRGSDQFNLSPFIRNWHPPQPGCKRILAKSVAAPAVNLSLQDLKSINDRLNSLWGDGHGTPDDIVNHAENLFAEMIQDVSERLSYVGPDTTSILIPAPVMPDRTIRVRYIGINRKQGILSSGQTRTAVPIGFSPWIVSRGLIRSPSVFTGSGIVSKIGPYRVITEGPPPGGKVAATSGFPRRPANI